ncbi:hypothetical protein [Pseudomonas atagonensis]|uniref:hypothetical protein n=1 Tax=Pseudomonas atagonensis TaxID=2609964 RepID=UPI00140AC817|nr:hypothetical protein [Pseudomonas atagonensis]
MRYLKVTAQDRSANGWPDTVLLHFYEETTGARDALTHRAYALDITADGKVDFQAGDANNDGKENTKDERLLKSFANAFLQIDWFNRGLDRARSLKIFTEDFAGDGSPDTVRLHFYEGLEKTPEWSIAHTASSYDSDNDGKLDWVVSYDMNNSGERESRNQKLVSMLSALYLKFEWR